MQIQPNEARADARTRPLEILCPSPEADEIAREVCGAPHAAAPQSGESRRPARALPPPGRPLEQIMRAFREQRRIEQEEGPGALVIETVLAARGPGSLAADLARDA